MFILTLLDPEHRIHTTSVQNMTLKVIFRSNPIKNSKIDLSPNELLIISNSILNFDNLTDDLYS